MFNWFFHHHFPKFFLQIFSLVISNNLNILLLPLLYQPLRGLFDIFPILFIALIDPPELKILFYLLNQNYHISSNIAIGSYNCYFLADFIEINFMIVLFTLLFSLEFLYFFKGLSHTHVFQFFAEFFVVLSQVTQQILANSQIFSRIGLSVFTAMIFFSLIDLGGNITPSFLKILQLSMMLLYTLSSKMKASYHSCTRYSTLAQILFQFQELDLISFKKLVFPLNQITIPLPSSVARVISSEMIIYSQPDENFYCNSLPEIQVSVIVTIIPQPQAIFSHFFIYYIPTTILLSPFGIRSMIYSELIRAIRHITAKDFDGSSTSPSILCHYYLRSLMFYTQKSLKYYFLDILQKWIICVNSMILFMSKAYL